MDGFVTWKCAVCGMGGVGELPAEHPNRCTPTRIAELERDRAAPGHHLREVDASLTRATQNGMAARIRELEAEVARLTPSGQVAERVASIRQIVMDFLPDGPTRGDRLADLAILAAKAQGYEVMEQRLRAAEAAAVSTVGGLVEGAPTTRINYLQRLRALVEKEQGYEAAVADNAALLTWIDRWGHASWCERNASITAGCTEQCAANVITQEPHPGAALLEQLATLRGVQAQAQVDAKFIHEALGWAGEWPTSLPAPSRVVVALLEQHAKALVQAKNDGVEAAARWHEERAKSSRRKAHRERGQRMERSHQELEWAATCDEYVAKELRKLKTCGDASCARCKSGEPCH